MDIAPLIKECVGLLKGFINSMNLVLDDLECSNTDIKKLVESLDTIGSLLGDQGLSTFVTQLREMLRAVIAAECAGTEISDVSKDEKYLHSEYRDEVSEIQNVRNTVEKKDVESDSLSSKDKASDICVKVNVSKINGIGEKGDITKVKNVIVKSVTVETNKTIGTKDTTTKSVTNETSKKIDAKVATAKSVANETSKKIDAKDATVKSVANGTSKKIDAKDATTELVTSKTSTETNVRDPTSENGKGLISKTVNHNNITLNSGTGKKNVDTSDDHKEDKRTMEVDSKDQGEGDIQNQLVECKQECALLQMRLLSAILTTLLPKLVKNRHDDLLFHIDRLKTCQVSGISFDELHILSCVDDSGDVSLKLFRNISQNEPVIEIKSECIKTIYEHLLVFIQMSNLPLYNPKSKQGFWKSFIMKVNQRGECLIEVNVDVMSITDPEQQDLVVDMPAKLKKYFHSADLKNCNIMSLTFVTQFHDISKPEVLIGDQHITEVIDSIEVQVGTSKVSSYNPFAMKSLSDAILDLLDLNKDTGVLQLDCMSALPTLYMAKFCRRLTLIHSSSVVGSFISTNAFCNNICNFTYITQPLKEFIEVFDQNFTGCKSVCVVIFNLNTSLEDLRSVQQLQRCKNISKILCVSSFEELSLLKKVVGFCVSNDYCKDPFVITKCIPVDLSSSEQNVLMLYLLERESTVHHNVEPNSSFSQAAVKKLMNAKVPAIDIVKDEYSKNMLITLAELQQLSVLWQVIQEQSGDTEDTAGDVRVLEIEDTENKLVIDVRDEPEDLEKKEKDVIAIISKLLSTQVFTTEEEYKTLFELKKRWVSLQAEMLSSKLKCVVPTLVSDHSPNLVFKFQDLIPCSFKLTHCSKYKVVLGKKSDFAEIGYSVNCYNELVPMRILRSYTAKKVYEMITTFIQSSGYPVFHLEKKEGFWRGFTLRTNFEGRTWLIIEGEADTKVKAKQIQDHLAPKLKSYFTSKEFQIVCNLCSLILIISTKNGTEIKVLFGDAMMNETVANLKVKVHSIRFPLYNPYGMIELSNSLLDILGKDNKMTVIQVGCGCGIESLFMAKECENFYLARKPDLLNIFFYAKENGIKRFNYVPCAKEEIMENLLRETKSSNNVCIVYDLTENAGYFKTTVLRNTANVKKIVFILNLENSIWVKEVVALCKNLNDPFVVTKFLAVDMSPNDDQIKLMCVLERASMLRGKLETNKAYSEDAAESILTDSLKNTEAKEKHTEPNKTESAAVSNDTGNSSDIKATVKGKENSSDIKANVKEKENSSDIKATVKGKENRSDIKATVKGKENSSDIKATVKGKQNSSDIKTTVKEKENRSDTEATVKVEENSIDIKATVKVEENSIDIKATVKGKENSSDIRSTVKGKENRSDIRSTVKGKENRSDTEATVKVEENSSDIKATVKGKENSSDIKATVKEKETIKVLSKAPANVSNIKPEIKPAGKPSDSVSPGSDQVQGKNVRPVLTKNTVVKKSLEEKTKPSFSKIGVTDTSQNLNIKRPSSTKIFPPQSTKVARTNPENKYFKELPVKYKTNVYTKSTGELGGKWINLEQKGTNQYCSTGNWQNTAPYSKDYISPHERIDLELSRTDPRVRDHGLSYSRRSRSRSPRDSLREPDRRSLEDDRRRSLEDDRRRFLEDDRRYSLEDSRRRFLEDDRRRFLEDDRRYSLEDDRRRFLEDDRRYSLEDDRKRFLEDDRRYYRPRSRSPRSPIAYIHSQRNDQLEYSRRMKSPEPLYDRERTEREVLYERERYQESTSYNREKDDRDLEDRLRIQRDLISERERTERDLIYERERLHNRETKEREERDTFYNCERRDDLSSHYSRSERDVFYDREKNDDPLSCHPRHEREEFYDREVTRRALYSPTRDYRNVRYD